jgi:hypothetical protein
MKLFPEIKVNFPKEFQLGRFGARTKLFNFQDKKVYTFTNNFREIKNRNSVKRYFNIPKIIKKRKDYFVEEFLFPYQNLNEREIYDSFEQLIKYYKYHSKEQKPSDTSIYGDFWKGNLIKYKGKIYFLDWDNLRKDILTTDFVCFFKMEYVYGGKINKKLIKEVAQLFMKNFGLGKKEFVSLVNLTLEKIDKIKDSKIKKYFLEVVDFA